MGMQARETAEKYTWEMIADQYEKLCYQVAEKKKLISSHKSLSKNA